MDVTTRSRRLVPHDSVVALIVAPTVWLAYFVATFLVTTVACERRWPGTAGPGFGLTNLVLLLIAVGSLALIGFATLESYRNLRAAGNPAAPADAGTRARWSFIAKAGLFLCGISLLGTLWGAINIAIFPSCAE